MVLFDGENHQSWYRALGTAQRTTFGLEKNEQKNLAGTVRIDFEVYLVLIIVAGARHFVLAARPGGKAPQPSAWFSRAVSFVLLCTRGGG